MNSELSFDGKTYVSVSRASKKLGYTADYIGQLCRAGKIDAKMIGRTWYVEWDSLRNHKKSKQNRVRRTAEEVRLERLGGSKTTYILDEELPTLSSLSAENNFNKISNEKLFVLPNIQDEDCPPKEYLKKIDDKKFSENKKLSTPPIATENWLPKLIKKDQKIISPYLKDKKFSPRYLNKIAGLLILIFVFTIVSSWLNFTQPQMLQTAIIPKIQNLQNETAIFFNPNGNQLSSVTTSDIEKSKNLSSVISSIKDELSYVLDSLKSQVNHLALIYMKSLGFVPENTIQTTSNSSRVGLVVVPDDQNHDATVTTIKNSFSDRVDVREDKDHSSGIIVPQFKTTKDTAYTYVMVPINSP